jgi:acyl-coenzyme A synthetase/AMP-(fatty) acid ligase/acyl carrier protein
MAMYLREGISATFREQADKIAFHIEDTTVTYAGLDEKSARLASWLLKEHEEPYFAVLCDQSINVAVAHVAALRAGKVLVALDPREPTKRTSAILELLGCTAVFSSEPADQTSNNNHILSDLFGYEVSSREWNIWNPDDVCWIYFTSGSTGEPKGVPVLYKRRIPNYFMAGNLKPGDKVAITRPVSFLAGGTALLSSIESGCEIYQYDLAEMSAHDLLRSVAENEISHLQLPPSLFRDERFRREAYRYEGCREITMTGERSTKSDLENLWTFFPHAKIQNSYGSTELGTVARHAFLPGTILPNDPLPVGLPIDCEVFIFEDNYGLVAQGGIGQIAVVSDRRSPNYLLANGPTALNEYEIRQGVHAVLTGDAGYFDEDGLLHVIGRIDDIVKINGNLTNMSSVNAVLMKHQDVANAEVLSFSNKKNRKKLGAVVVAKEGAQVSASMLREYLLAELPTWMVPTRFEFVDALPVSSRGKTDRQKLLQILSDGKKELKGSSDLGDPLIWRLIVFLREFIDVEELDQFENLQFYGLDSLDIVELVEMVNTEFSVRLPISFFATEWSLYSLRSWLIEQDEKKQNRIVTVSSGSRPIDLYWLMPGTNLVVGLPLANHLQGYASRFFVAKGSESHHAPFLETKLISQELVEQLVRQLDFKEFALIGFSSAAWIAQHMAVMMKQMGVPPSVLVLLDPPFGDAVENPSAPPKPELLMKAREGELAKMRQHDSDVGLLTLQMFGLRHHVRIPYDGKTLVITSSKEEKIVEASNALFSQVSIEYVEAEHLELMRNPEICGPIIRTFLDSSCR